MSQHAIVFLDHHQAKVFHLDGSDKHNVALKEAAVRETDNRHAQDGKRPSHETFFHDVAQALKGATEILIVGPGTARNEFKHHLEKHDHDVNKHVVAVEAIDHPTVPELLALAKKRFKVIDQWV